MGTMSIWHWIVVLTALGLPAAAIIFFMERSNKASNGSSSDLSGIGGWLILPIWGFVGTVAFTGYNVIQMFGEIEGIKIILSANEGPISGLKFPFFTSISFGIAVIVSGCFCLYYIFSTKKGIAKITTGHYVILVLAALSNLWADDALRVAVPSAPQDPSVLKGAVRNILIALVWTPYFWLSKRVKNTFENSNAAAISAVGNPLSREIAP